MNDIIDKEISNIFSIHKKIINLKNEVGRKLYKMGAYLKLIKDKELHKELGYDTFESYIAQPELSLKRSMVYSLIGVSTDFIEDKRFQNSDIENINYYALDRIRQFKDNEDIKEWISKARELSLSDLNISIREAKGEKEKVYIPEKKSYTVTCPHCGCQFEHFI